MALSKYCELYKQWAVTHPETLSELESVGRLVSYFVAGRFKSSIVSEFLYSATNLIVLINDRILFSSLGSNPIGQSTPLPHVFTEKLRVFMTTIEYLEVFVEITASSIWGQRGKWLVITVIQLLKATWRLFVLIQNRTGLAQARPIPPLDRKKLRTQAILSSLNIASTENGIMMEQEKTFFTLKSGKVIRTVTTAPQLHRRTWKAPTVELTETNQFSILEGKPLAGEMIFIAKPLCHLAAMRKYGTRAWLPYLLSLSLDAISLALLKNLKTANPEERKELSRRQMCLLLYLLRSPFYERCSKGSITSALLLLAKIPLVRILSKPMLQYLPQWQQLYSYTWSQ